MDLVEDREMLYVGEGVVDPVTLLDPVGEEVEE